MPWKVLYLSRPPNPTLLSDNDKLAIARLSEELDAYLEHGRRSWKSDSAADAAYIYASIPIPQHAQVLTPVYHMNLPAEVLATIQPVAYMHQLALNPDRVLPSGKSLLSVLAKPHSEEAKPARGGIERQVAEMVTRAFWDEALASLSSDSGAQIARLSVLYQDLHTAMQGLIPTDSPVMVTLSDPFSPSSSPLQTCSTHMLALLATLKRRCAPVRDATIDELRASLEGTISAKKVVDVIKGILSLADVMRQDALSFVAAKWNEDDARRWLYAETLQRERAALSAIWDQTQIQNMWSDWVGPPSSTEDMSARQRWISRLVAAIGKNDPIAPALASSAPNALPPPFLFCTMDLLRVQNHIQALVIVASLFGLVGGTTSSGSPLARRLWTLMKAEADSEMDAPPETTLLHLGDEIAKAWYDAHPDALDAPEQEAKLREAVKRLLRYEDPVFSLLRRRILSALDAGLCSSLDRYKTRAVPVRLQAGRAAARSATPESGEPWKIGPVKGFDDPALKEAVNEVMAELWKTVLWVSDVWGSMLETSLSTVASA